MVLLHMWSSYLQRKAARQPSQSWMKLHILVIEPSTVNPAIPPCDDRFSSVQAIFPQHEFTKVSFHDVLEFDDEIIDALLAFAGTNFVNDESHSNRDRLDNLRASIASPTSRDDTDNVLITRLIVAYAKKLGCHAVAWGDSDSRLAAKILSGVAKGRGSSLTWQVCDGMTPWNLRFGFPLRDIYRPELELFASQISSLSEVILPSQPPPEHVASRNLSIDELMTQYIHVQGEKYRGVMANIVRTVDKLQPLPIHVDTEFCTLCSAPSGAEDLTNTAHIGICYGCSRSIS
jgi:cytoplasmic tRNA 2-thiolation protein 2